MVSSDGTMPPTGRAMPPVLASLPRSRCYASDYTVIDINGAESQIVEALPTQLSTHTITKEEIFNAAKGLLAGPPSGWTSNGEDFDEGESGQVVVDEEEEGNSEGAESEEESDEDGDD